MDDLTKWLRQQLDEIEADANAIMWDGSGNVLRWDEVGSATVDIGSETIHFGDRTIKNHVMNHDPASVLADIKAKRDVLDRYVRTCEIRDAAKVKIGPAAAAGVAPPADALRDWSDASSEVAVLEQPIQYLAAAYAHRPGYKEAWRP